MVAQHYSPVEQQLLNDFQHDMPLTATPYADMAKRLGVSEAEVLAMLQSFRDEGVISRIGPVLATHRVGASTLVAMAVPEVELESIADIVTAHPAVNHNYEREHRFNLWFVATAPNESRLAACITELEQATGYRAMVLPMLENYHIDLGFDLQWK